MPFLSTVTAENWQNYPYIVEWVESMKKWAAEYEIFEFIPSVDGFDPSGRIPLDLFEPDTGSIPIDRIWTEIDDGQLTSEFMVGDWGSGGVVGWYVGRVSHEGKPVGLVSGYRLCLVCEGNYYFEDESGEEVYCDDCSSGKTDYLWINNTDFF